MKRAPIILRIFILIGSAWTQQSILKSGVLIEDDIMLNENVEHRDRHLFSSSDGFARQRWPGGIVPYDYNKTVYSSVDLYVIQEGLKVIEKNTCIRFTPRTNEIDYIYITPHDGCWSYLGRQGSGQVLSLTVPQCIERGIVIHEVLHALGLWHEHSRPDRDQFVEVLWDNINEEKQANFVKQKVFLQAWTDIPYDYKSVMHYTAFAFSKHPYVPTMKPKATQVRLKDLGRAKVVGTLTESDKFKINSFYECAAKLKTSSVHT